MKPRDQTLSNFTEKLFVTNQQENPSNNQDAPHLQNICYRNSANHFDEDHSQQPQPLLQSSHEDQSLQPNIHHRSQEADLCPQPPLSVKHAEPKEEKSTERLNGLQQTTNEIQSTPTDLVQQFSNFFQHQTIVLSCTAFVSRINNIRTPISNV